MSMWTEDWDGADGASWPNVWSVAGNGTATIQGARGRLTTGSGVGAATRARFDGMDDCRDVEVLVTFTVSSDNEWYLTVGTRTQSNQTGPGGNNAFTSRGAYLQLFNFLGFGALLVREGYDSGHDNIASAPSVPAMLAGTQYRLRFRVEERRLRARVWPAASPEPSSWIFDVEDPDAYSEPGKITLAFQTANFSSDTVSKHVDFDDLVVTNLDPIVLAPVPSKTHVWTMESRAANFASDLALPIASIKLVKRHMGVNRAVVETGFTPARWASLQPGRGLVLHRDGRQEFTGKVTAREHTLDARTGKLRIKIEAGSDELDLADRLAFPDPLRAADDQTVSDYWIFNGPASTAMLKLISDQAGPTAHPDRRVPGLTVGPDPGVGVTRAWSARYTSAGDDGVLDVLNDISITSGADLGLRATSSPNVLRFDIVQPRDLTGDVRFSADLNNLVGYSYREEAPSCTDALSAGQGDLRLRKHKHVRTVSTLALAWGRQIWRYVDRRDTADDAELLKASTDEVTEGDAKVSLAVTLTESQASLYGTDWDLGDRITIYVAPPGHVPTVTVADVVREILFEVDAEGVEQITPAVGTHDATALPASPNAQQLARIGSSLAALKSWK